MLELPAETAKAVELCEGAGAGEHEGTRGMQRGALSLEMLTVCHPCLRPLLLLCFGHCV